MERVTEAAGVLRSGQRRRVRLGRRLTLQGLLAGLAVSAFTATVFSSVGLVYMGASSNDLLELLPLTVAYALACMLLGVAVALFRYIPRFARWVRGDISTDDVRLIAMAHVRIATITALVAAPTIAAAVIFVTRLPLFDLSTAEVVFGVVYIWIGLAFAWAATITVLESIVRPFVANVMDQIPDEARQTVTRWGLSAKTVTVFSIIPVATAVIAAAMVLALSNPNNRVAVGVVVTLSVSFLIGSPLVWLAVRTFLEPVMAVRAAAERVRQGQFDIPVRRTTTDEVGDLVESFNRMQAGLAERERLHSAFGSYVDPALAERLLAQGDDLFHGEEANVTVFFADIRNFTTYAEHASASDAVARLNALWDIIVPILRDHHGHANKFLGDGVLAVFGVPEEITDHADHAVAAAVEIQQRVADVFGPELRIGIGINTGNVIAGTIGGGGKLEFTLIGDPVNVAARVEQLTKETGDGILLTQATVDALRNPSPSLQGRGEFAVRGREARVAMYALDPQ